MYLVNCVTLYDIYVVLVIIYNLVKFSCCRYYISSILDLMFKSTSSMVVGCKIYFKLVRKALSLAEGKLDSVYFIHILCYI